MDEVGGVARAKSPLSLSTTLTHILSLSLFHTHTHTHTHFLSFSLSLSLTHTFQRGGGGPWHGRDWQCCARSARTPGESAPLSGPSPPGVVQEKRFRRVQQREGPEPLSRRLPVVLIPFWCLFLVLAGVYSLFFLVFILFSFWCLFLSLADVYS